MSYVNFKRNLSKAEIEALGESGSATNGKIYFASDGGIYVGDSSGSAQLKANISSWESGSGEWSAQIHGNSARGDYSVAEGVSSSAEGSGSHAEGYGTKAPTDYSHAEGNGTITSNSFEHAEGSYNVSHTSSSTYGSSGNTLKSIGVGTNNSDRKNAVEVMQNGDVYVLGVGGYSGSSISSSQTLAQTINSSVVGVGVVKIVALSESEYSGMSVKDPTTLYIVTPDPSPSNGNNGEEPGNDVEIGDETILCSNCNQTFLTSELVGGSLCPHCGEDPFGEEPIEDNDDIEE